MIRLSERARKEIAIMHAADAMRVLAAAAIPLHILPLGGVLFASINFQAGWLLFFVILSLSQVWLHLQLLRSADDLLERTHPSFLLALTAGTLLLTITAVAQALVATVMGVGFFLLILIACGAFDIISLGALIYVYYTSFRALFTRNQPDPDRHMGFEVVLPDARAIGQDEQNL